MTFLLDIFQTHHLFFGLNVLIKKLIPPNITNVPIINGPNAIMLPGTIMGPTLTTDPSMGFAKFPRFRMHHVQIPIPAMIKIVPAIKPAKECPLCDRMYRALKV